MKKNGDKKVAMAVEEAARLLKENPHWTYKQAIAKAKELVTIG